MRTIDSHSFTTGVVRSSSSCCCRSMTCWRLSLIRVDRDEPELVEDLAELPELVAQAIGICAPRAAQSVEERLLQGEDESGRFGRGKALDHAFAR